VLQRESVVFAPALADDKRNAIAAIAMGPVVKLGLRFAAPFWAELENGKYADAGFFFGMKTGFPTFWTTYPTVSPLIVAWAGGPRSQPFQNSDHNTIVRQAIDELAFVFGLEYRDVENRLEAAYVHDWQRDPFAFGAYSYVRVGGGDARKVLAQPVERTLYFAGEATAQGGESGTVAGALESGYAAANAVLNPSTGSGPFDTSR
jgi:monoamine oxidase